MKASLALFAAVPLAILIACGTSRDSDFNDGTDTSKDAGGIFDPGNTPDTGPPLNGRDPVDCEEAKLARSYVGCDYWPTIMPNIVQDVFDFAVAVANVGEEAADVTVTGPGGVTEKVTVAAGGLEKVYLPWVDNLKNSAGSFLAKKSAYHLVSSRPVVVYQFNPLEFKAAGGPPGKDWSACQRPQNPYITECYSYTNDASLLLPSTAMTGTYRVMGSTGFSKHPRDEQTTEPDLSQPVQDVLPSYFAVTGTQDGTSVTLKLGSKATVAGSSGIASTAANGTLTIKLGAGDVALVATELGKAFDVSGSLVMADKPVQVISGVACLYLPFDIQACDHIEETVFPAETLGKHYIVTRPTGPYAKEVPHIVRLFGNVDGTKLTYKPSMPSGCPATLAAGEVVECGAQVTTDFEVSGDHEFGVGMFMLGGTIIDPEHTDPTGKLQPLGDPSQSFAVTVEQYRKRYVFLAPADYKANYVDVIGPATATLKLDGKDVSSSFEKITGTEWHLARIKLGSGGDGTHILESSEPVGIQVLGYGENTSYQYPGGLNLGQISAPPVK